MSKNKKIPIYFDNNGSTFIDPKVSDIYCSWLSCYNPSISSIYASNVKEEIEETISYVLSHCGVSLLTHNIIFTSGATEGNCFILRTCAKAHLARYKKNGVPIIPHIVSSKMEHNSIISCLEDLKENGIADYTLVSPREYGQILPSDVDAAIRSNTCLVSIMFANNEVPVVNNIKEIAKVCHKHGKPLHSDCVQIFGKIVVNVKELGIDVLTASAHKLYGPKGSGIVILSKEIIDGYQLTAEINGTQQGGLRGGTENPPAIISWQYTIKQAFTNRIKKNNHLENLRTRLLEKLAGIYNFGLYKSYVNNSNGDDGSGSGSGKPKITKALELISLGPPNSNNDCFVLFNTVLLAICKNKGRLFCNVKLKEYLDSKGCIISIGSACNTSSKKASHIMDSIGASEVVRKGVVRISFGDHNTISEVDEFISHFYDNVDMQCSDLDPKEMYINSFYIKNFGKSSKK